MSFLIGATLLSQSCRTTHEKDASEIRSIELANEFAGLSKKVDLDRLVVCLIADAAVRDKWQKWTEKSIMDWVKPLRTLTTKPLVTHVEFVSDTACAKADLIVNVNRQMMRAFCPIASAAWIKPACTA